MARSAGGRRPFASARWSTLFAHSYPYLILIFLNLLFFHEHYAGRSVFPWDFWGGYHAEAYAWFADGSLSQPLLWSPYGNYGFPAHLSLQNSSYYPLLMLADELGMPYTLTVATRVQCLHILLGAVGVYVFLGLNGLSSRAALTGAILYHLSAGFFSNAQHVDIVRGYALLPWMLTVYSRKFLLSSRRAVLAAWLTFAFVSGSYPGIVVATFYVMSVYVLIMLFRTGSGLKSKWYLSYCAVGAGIAGLLLCLKFLPVIPLRDEFQLLPGVVGDESSVVATNFLTTFFRFDLPFLKMDITMRSYYLPPLAVLLAFVGSRRGKLWFMSVLLLLTSLAFLIGPFHSWLLNLPGMRLSRFHYTDFRGLIHLAVIAVACSNLDGLARGSCSRRGWVWGLAAAGVVFIGVTIAALLAGYSMGDINTELAVILVTVAAAVMARRFLADPGWRGVAGWASLWATAIVGACLYFQHTTAPWSWRGHEWWFNEKYYGRSGEALYPDRKHAWQERPTRTGDTEIELGAQNLGYYVQKFSALGWDAGLRLKRVAGLRAQIGAESNRAAKEFLAGPSAALVLDANSGSETMDELADLALPAREDRPVTVEMRRFGLQSSEYRVHADDDFLLVENEVHFPGWRSKICAPSGCRAGPDSRSVFGALRGWSLPAGTYSFRTFYQPPAWRLSRFAFGLGVLASGLLLVRRFPKRLPRPTSK